MEKVSISTIPMPAGVAAVAKVLPFNKNKKIFKCLLNFRRHFLYKNYSDGGAGGAGGGGGGAGNSPYFFS